jgi:long-chain acyl-CoA synthetase
VPNLDTLKSWATAKKLGFGDDGALLRMAEVHDKIEREVKKALRDLAQYQMPKKVLLLLRDFSIESGELTPTLKVKRRVVERHYQEQIDALYTEGIKSED